jgi:outer membrane protein OmpA-like peptidoglycan-associated protein
MRLPLLLTAFYVAAAAPALAQVTVDLHALQALPERPAAPAAPHRTPTTGVSRAAPVARPSQSAVAKGSEPTGAVAKETEPTGAKEAKQEAPVTVVPPAQQPAMPENAPQTAAIEPIAPPPPAAGAAPPPVSANAGTVAAPTSAGLRLTFAPGQSDLSPESAASIKKLTSEVTVGDSTTFNVSAFAPGTPDDPSTARRLSLSRAMAVRSALVADGVPSPRIFVRALGAQYGEGPADRVDLDVTGASTSEAASK